MNPLCFVVWIVVIAFVPLLIIYRITESQQQKVNRLRRSGWTQKRIAERLGITTYRVRKQLSTT